MSFFKTLAKIVFSPDRVLFDLWAATGLKFIQKRLDSIATVDADKAEKIRGTLKSSHLSLVKIDAILLALVPFVVLTVLVVITALLLEVASPWGSWHRFAVVWIIVSIYLIYLDYRNGLGNPLRGFPEKFGELLPENCRSDDADKVYEKYNRLFLKIRRFIEILTLTIGTLLNGYGDLVQAELLEYLK